MINSKDFSFSKKEVEILFLIKYLALKETIKEFKHKSLSSLVFKEKAEKEEKKIRSLQEKWLSEWSEKATHLLKFNKDIEFLDIINELKKIDLTKGKLNSIIADCVTFTPFYPLKAKDRRFKNLSFDDRAYLKKLAMIFPRKYMDLRSCRSAFDKSIKVISKDVSKNSNWLIWTSALALLAVIIAPHLATWIGSTFLGLSGAAATSAGLALLGGGAISAGGLGMAGGTIAIMVGGAIIGYGVGSSKYKTHIRGLSNEAILLYCAQLCSVLDLYGKEKKLIIKEYCKSSRILQSDLEQDVDEYFINTYKLDRDKKKAKDLKRKPAILVSFRRYLRVMDLA